jgi:hypothetical protein
MQRIQMQATKRKKTPITASLNGFMDPIGMMWAQQAYEEQHNTQEQSQK